MNNTARKTLIITLVLALLLCISVFCGKLLITSDKNVASAEEDTTTVDTPSTSIPIIKSLEVRKYSIYKNAEQTEVLNSTDETVMKEYAKLHNDFVPIYFSIDFEDEFIYLDVKTDNPEALVRTSSGKEIKGDGNADGDGGENQDSGLKLGINEFEQVPGEAINKKVINLTVFYQSLTNGATHYCLYITRLPEKNNKTDAEIYFDDFDNSPLIAFNNAYAADHGKKVVYGTSEQPYLYSVAYDISTVDITVNVNPDADALTAVGTFQVLKNEVVVVKDKPNGSRNPLDLDYGVNVIKVEITASDGETQKVIAVLVYRERAVFDSITIEEIPDFKYSSQQFKNENEEVNYSCSVDSNVSKLTLNIAVNEDYGLTYDVVGNFQRLEKGHNTIFIYLYEGANLLNDEEGIAAMADNSPLRLRTLILNVYREPKDNSIVWTVFFFIFLVLVIIETILLILLITNKNKNEEQVVTVVEPEPISVEPQPQIQPTILQPIIQPVPCQQMPSQVVIQQIPVQQKSNQPPVNVMVNLKGTPDKDGFYDNYSNIKDKK